jgi:hypothetical protein
MGNKKLSFLVFILLKGLIYQQDTCCKKVIELLKNLAKEIFC